MRNKTNHTPLTRGSRLTDAKLLLIITICVFAVMYLCAVLFLGSGFKKPQTFFNILNENAALLILSCGMSLVMITGGIDISVGTLTALVCMSCAVHLDYQGGTVLTAVLLALGIGTAFGLVQGFLIAYLEIQPFIVTLAGMFFAKGMTTIVNATQFNVENEAFKALKETRIYVPGMGSVNKLGAYVPAYVEIGVVVALVIVLAAAGLLALFLKTRLGLSIRATGDNPDMVRASSINTAFTVTVGLCLSNAMTALSGAVLAQYQKTADINLGTGMVIIGLASLIIGETLMPKGKTWMKALGAILGSILYRFIIAIALRLDLPSECLKLISAVIVALAIGLPAIKSAVRPATKGGKV